MRTNLKVSSKLLGSAVEVMMVVVLVALAVEQEAEATSPRLTARLSHYQQTVVNWS